MLTSKIIKNEDTINSKLTIYSESGHMIQSIAPGTSSVVISKYAVLESIIAINSLGNIISFSYVPELGSSIPLTNRITGEKLNVRVTKGENTIEGKIVSIDSNNVVILVKDELVSINKYDSVIVPGSSYFGRSSIIFSDISSAITLSYLLHNISWSCFGTALIDEVNSILYLRLAGNISNDTEANITAETTLVSGEVYQNSNNNMKISYRRKSAPMQSEQVLTSRLEEFTKYNVGNRTVRNKDIAELGTTTYPITKIYSHSTDRRQSVSFGYLFIAKDFIPNCFVNTYSIKKDVESKFNFTSIDSFIGADNIKESQKDDKIYLMLGDTTMVSCSTNVETSKIKSSSQKGNEYKLPSNLSNNLVVTESIKSVINNRNEFAVKLSIKHPIYDKYYISGGDCGGVPVNRKGKYLIWELDIPAKTQADFECKVITAELENSVSY